MVLFNFNYHYKGIMLQYHSMFGHLVSDIKGLVFTGTSTKNVYIIDRLRQELEHTRSQCAPSTNKNKLTAINAFERFIMAAMSGQTITVKTLSGHHIRSFEQWALDNGLSPNYVALHMRSLRALVKGFVRNGNKLFENVNTSRCQTRKRAVGEATIRQIAAMPLPEGSSIDQARAVMLICFYGMGIPLIDAVYMKRKDYKGGSLTYYRHKTHRMVTVRVEESLKELLDRFITADSPYLLPVLTSKDPEECRRQYRRFYQRYSRALAKISKMLGLDSRLTSYVPRHSWASIAYKNGVDVNTIASALGHANTNVTYAYLQEITNDQLSRANQVVIKAIR